jgi:hypothetical protein
MMRKDAGTSLDYCMPAGCKLKRDFLQWHGKRIPYRGTEREIDRTEPRGNIKVKQKKER